MLNLSSHDLFVARLALNCALERLFFFFNPPALRKFEIFSHGLTKWPPRAFPFENVRLEEEGKNGTKRQKETKAGDFSNRERFQFFVCSWWFRFFLTTSSPTALLCLLQQMPLLGFFILPPYAEACSEPVST